MIKKYLIEYSLRSVMSDYELKIKTVWFWGLFSTVKFRKYPTSVHTNIYKLHRHWDRLIEEKINFND